MGGFECSTQRNLKGKRVDVIAATSHDRFAEADYGRLSSVGMRTARDGARWHLIERTPFRYDFSSALNQIRAAEKTKIQVIWDLFHYGYPGDLNIFSAEFPIRFAAFSEAFVRLLKNETKNSMPFFCPVNEISFFSWIAGEVGGFYPFQKKRGDEIKSQLVRASIAAIEAIRGISPEARFVQTDPAINITAARHRPQDKSAAENARQSQFHALEMLIGKREPVTRRRRKISGHNRLELLFQQPMALRQRQKSLARTFGLQAV